MSTLLSLLDDDAPDGQLIATLARIGPIIVPSQTFSALSLPQSSCSYHILVDRDTPVTLQQVIAWLDEGAETVILSAALAKAFTSSIPANRLTLLLDAQNSSAVSDSVGNGVSGVLVKTPVIDIDLITSFSKFFNLTIYTWATQTHPLQSSVIRQVIHAGASVVLPSSQLTLAVSTSSKINIAEAFLAPLISDRSDGLFPTVVSGIDGRSLGLVYSSFESVKESILTGKGVYQSRKHGLWRKGETSGSTQDVISVRMDCDSDSLEFIVVQHGVGFCHLNRKSCFGNRAGISTLEETLQSRLQSAPEGSYTKRLFDDAELLRSKIMEEADELCNAKTKDEIAFEAADLLYFVLTRCVAAGLGFSDIERSLDRKAKKITRRPGNSKPQWTSKGPTPPSAPPIPAPILADVNAPIKMYTADLATITPEERAQLLRRPVLKSDEMISKVKPIVDDVRIRGDVAVLELTAKFDKVKLSSTVISPPFSPESMRLEDHVRLAIDSAYANIRKFHEAQAERSELVVETMPGVVCSRFARPIARVGLYVPGGTAILPSTALMLGIPAQVAGCKTIVLATPPRSDGTISPEVMYVAHLVGASAIVTAGGAQAIAAMAYGTATVPKVDKLFGPGNQWVTAAKMTLQNDTDALVSIDMPAGPSEVLVIADDTCNPAFVASDLLSQAEHGVDSQVVLAAVDLATEKLAAIEAEIDAQARKLSRVDIIRQSISKSIIVKTSSADDAIQFSNDYAPEHLILHIKNASEKLSSIVNAGSVFVGHYSPESCGDYASGTNHTLPTNGYARQFSGVNTLSFQKHITSQEITTDGLKVLGPIVATLADCEGLDAHAQAVRIRLNAINA